MGARDECFWLPHGGAIFGLFIGAIIILWGVSEAFGWKIELGSFAAIAIGLLIVAGAIRIDSKKKLNDQPSLRSIDDSS